MTPDCVLCQMWRRGSFGTATLDDLCPRHRSEIESSLAENHRIHPDGHCTGACGCIGVDEFFEGITA